MHHRSNSLMDFVTKNFPYPSESSPLFVPDCRVPKATESKKKSQSRHRNNCKRLPFLISWCLKWPNIQVSCTGLRCSGWSSRFEPAPVTGSCPVRFGADGFRPRRVFRRGFCLSSKIAQSFSSGFNAAKNFSVPAGRQNHSFVPDGTFSFGYARATQP